MKKPLLQVLIRGFERPSDGSNSDIVLLPPGTVGKVPSFCTGHQAFHQICAAEIDAGHELPESIKIAVHQYTLNPFAPLLAVKLSTPGSTFFELRTKNPPPKKVERKLLGIRMKKRKRTRPAGKGSGKGRPKGSPTQTDHAKDIDHQLKCMANPQLSASVEQDSDIDMAFSDHDQGSESESSLSGHDGSDSIDGGSPPTPFGEVAEEPVRPPEKIEEEAELTRLDLEREKRMQDLSGNTGDNPRPTCLPKTSFCNQSLGLVDAGIQVASRCATCRHCLTKIEKQCVRFQYAWSLKKFASWLHTECVLPHLIQEGASFLQASNYVSGVVQDMTKAPEVREAASSLKRKLQSHSRESASAHGEKHIAN